LCNCTVTAGVEGPSTLVILFTEDPTVCSTGLNYSLLTHIILHQFIHIKQAEARKMEARSSGKKRIRKDADSD